MLFPVTGRRPKQFGVSDAPIYSGGDGVYFPVYGSTSQRGPSGVIGRNR